MPRTYVPDASNGVRLKFNPQAEHEQAGHRPALVISPASNNGKTGLMVCCRMSTMIKGHPFEVVTSVNGVDCTVHSAQVKSLDWKVRSAKKSHGQCGSADTCQSQNKRLAADHMMTAAVSPRTFGTRTVCRGALSLQGNRSSHHPPAKRSGSTAETYNPAKSARLRVTTGSTPTLSLIACWRAGGQRLPHAMPPSRRSPYSPAKRLLLVKG
jgi:mRNA interferase MazF